MSSYSAQTIVDKLERRTLWPAFTVKDRNGVPIAMAQGPQELSTAHTARVPEFADSVPVEDRSSPPPSINVDR